MYREVKSGEKRTNKQAENELNSLVMNERFWKWKAVHKCINAYHEVLHGYQRRQPSPGINS